MPELENTTLHQDSPRQSANDPENRETLNNHIQRMSSIAMEHAANLLSQLLQVSVKQPAPNVSFIANSDLNKTIKAAHNSNTYSAVCQGFSGPGIAGEALLLFADANFRQMARLLHYDTFNGKPVNIGVLMDMSSILFGAFLKGMGDQLGLRLGIGHPTLLGQQQPVAELLENRSPREEQLLCIEISYNLEGRGIQCDMLLLLTEDSVPFLEQHLHRLNN